MKQVWMCEGCRKVGSVELEAHAGVSSAVFQIDDAHKAVSPDCPITVGGVMVLNLPYILKTDMPEWMAQAVSELLVGRGA